MVRTQTGAYLTEVATFENASPVFVAAEPTAAAVVWPAALSVFEVF